MRQVQARPFFFYWTKLKLGLKLSRSELALDRRARLGSGDPVPAPSEASSRSTVEHVWGGARGRVAHFLFFFFLKLAIGAGIAGWTRSDLAILFDLASKKKYIFFLSTSDRIRRLVPKKNTINRICSLEIDSNPSVFFFWLNDSDAIR
jgi:hypothetical protein